LGVKEIVRLGHKSGELGYISSTELREEMFAMIRYFKPRIIIIPDPYIHYDENRDHFYAGKMAEEAWGYSGAGTFSEELNRMGFPGYGVPEVYYYTVRRPYRAGEGGEGNAQFRPVDISATFERKVQAILALRTSNRLFAAQAAEQLARLGRPVRLDEAAVDKMTRAYLEELAGTIGKKHGFRYGEEFNYFGPKSGLPEHVVGHAVPAR
ncbi:MAG TPA: hypothetical protein VEU62_07780, partial [Bryobacterales bacterium]|nr:hypothetical protein [Bryobacterales bacterium]